MKSFLHDKRILITGACGTVGSAIVRRLKALGHTDIVTRTRQDLDLLNPQAVMHFMQSEKPDQLYLAAVKVGGNPCPAAAVL